MNPNKLVLFGLAAALFLSAQESNFPKGALSDNARQDEFRTVWYSTHLKALQELSLLQLAQNPAVQSYRFLWLRTFHHPVVVRLDFKSDGTGAITTKVASGAGGYKPGHLVENTTRPLSREQMEKFLVAVKRAQFWELPSHETPATEGCDGAQWIIEGVKDGEYHVVDRWTPSSGPVRDLGMLFLTGLAQMKIPENEIY
jgi:hypothetical protein